MKKEFEKQKLETAVPPTTEVSGSPPPCFMKKLSKIFRRGIYIPIFFMAACMSVFEIAIIGAFSFLFSVFEWVFSGDTVTALKIMDFSIILHEKIFKTIERITPNEL